MKAADDEQETVMDRFWEACVGWGIIIFVVASCLLTAGMLLFGISKVVMDVAHAWGLG